jgi:GNAT superfamily N-acetyltransferase
MEEISFQVTHMNISLRPAEQSDFDFCFHAKREAMGPYICARWGWDNQFQLDVHRRRWSERPWSVICNGDEPIGTVSVEWTDTHLRIGEFYLLKEMQRKGIGTNVLQSILQEADVRGLPAKLEHLKWNPVGSLYKRHGFEVVEENEIHYFLIRKPVGTQSKG